MSGDLTELASVKFDIPGSPTRVNTRAWIATKVEAGASPSLSVALSQRIHRSGYARLHRTSAVGPGWQNLP